MSEHRKKALIKVRRYRSVTRLIFCKEEIRKKRKKRLALFLEFCIATLAARLAVLVLSHVEARTALRAGNANSFESSTACVVQAVGVIHLTFGRWR